MYAIEIGYVVYLADSDDATQVQESRVGRACDAFKMPKCKKRKRKETLEGEVNYRSIRRLRRSFSDSEK